MFHINFQVTELVLSNARAANPGTVPRKTILPASCAQHIPFPKYKMTKNPFRNGPYDCTCFFWGLTAQLRLSL